MTRRHDSHAPARSPAPLVCLREEFAFSAVYARNIRTNSGPCRSIKFAQNKPYDGVACGSSSSYKLIVMPPKKTTAKKSSVTTRKKARGRELLEPKKGDKRFVRRSKTGQFKNVVDVGRSLSADKRRSAKKKVRKGQGDRGDT
jgi:hypothetical protein